MTIRIRAHALAVAQHPWSRSSLYPHQIAMWDAWDRHPTLMLTAKTGTGKTRAAMLPVLRRGEWAVAVYPTNELLRDQVRAVERFAADEGFQPLVLTPDVWHPEDKAGRYSAADRVLVPVDGALLDEWQRVLRCSARGEALRRVLNPDKPKIIFTNPDILFLILGLRYHAEALEALRRYSTLVADEFHLYHGVELAHAMVMVALARRFGSFRRFVLLSATPHPDVRVLLDRYLAPHVIESSPLATPSEQRWRVAVHEVDVTPIPVANDSVEQLVAQIIALKGELEHLRKEIPDDAYLPAVVIVNSVVNAIRLEDRLVEAGFARDSLAIIRGLSHRAVRNTHGKVLALGTSAIEVGVDFRCDFLIFEALDAASFLQRFGRVGRHRPGRAIVLVPPNALEGMSRLPSEVSRGDFEERVYAWYPTADARPWFVTSEHGMITARTLAENLYATVEKDSAATPQLLAQLRERIEATFTEFAERLGCAAQNTQAKLAFERCAAGKRTVQWLRTYRRLNRFRTSLPSVNVHDFSEQHRRQVWQLGEYGADLATLLKRAVGLAWNEKMGGLTLRGIGRYRRTHASEIFKDEDCGVIHETGNFPQLRLYQDGESTPVSDLMARENHIFALVPKADVESALDWRLPVFEAGRFALAFDGAALLLLELWRRG